MFLLKKIIFCFALAIAQALIPTSAQAATITVDNTGDVTGDDQVCTLREAIDSIHALTTVSTGCSHTGLYGIDDTIEFHPGLTNQIIQLTQKSTLSIRIDLVINGLGADQLTIDGSSNFNAGIFRIRPLTGASRITVDINKLKVSRGVRAPIDSGGGFNIFDTNLNLTDCNVRENTAGGGGGIFADDSLITLKNSEVSHNTANVGGGIYAVNESVVRLINNSAVLSNASADIGGGIFVGFVSTILVRDSIVSNNTAATDGGGIYGTGNLSYVDVFESTVSGNTADRDGGGIYITEQSDASVNRSTVSGNSAAGQGGGIIGISSNVTIGRSTISDNTALLAGGIFYGSNDSGRSLLIVESTITKNSATDDIGGMFVAGDAAIARLFASIFSGNNAIDLGDEIGQFGGVILADESNLFGDSSNTSAQAFSGFSPELLGSDIIATSDGTLPTALTSILDVVLRANGGPTKTHALVTGSPAIDAGRPVCSSTDQRGVSVSDGACDIGSYEYSPLIFSDGFE